MISITEQRDDLLAMLEGLGDRDARYRYLITAGKQAPAIAEQFRSAPYEVKGCLVKSWFVVEKSGDRFHFSMDSESIIVRGIMNTLLSLYNNRTAAEIGMVSPSFLSQAGLLETTSSNRRNGLAIMCRQIEDLGASH